MLRRIAQVLELKIPPPVVALGCAALMYGLARLLPDWRWSWPYGSVAGVVFALGGLALDAAGVWAFRRVRTTINPLKPGGATAVVRHGIYRYTRNPMYLGLLLVLLGFALYLAHPLAFLGPPLLVAYLTRFQIVPEERVLRAKFGAEYADYVARVRRWV